jgi:uncharacterized protein
MTNLDVVKETYAAFGRGDIPAVLGAMAPEMAWSEAEGNPYMPTGEPWIGPDTILEKLFMRLGSEWDGFTVHPGTFHGAGDVVVMEGRYTGTYLPTGRALDAQVCHVWTLKDGKLVKFQQYVDTGQFQDVMGAGA